MKNRTKNITISAVLLAALLLLNWLGQPHEASTIFITATLTLGLTVLFHNTLKINVENCTTQRRWALTGLSYFAIILGLVLLTWRIKTLSFAPDVSLGLFDFYQADAGALLTLLSIALVLLALYLFSHRLMTNIAHIGLSKYARLGALGIALTIAAPIILGAGLQFSLVVSLLAVFIYIALFDLFIDNQIPGITWFIIWLVLFAYYTAVLLQTYNPITGNSNDRIISLFSCAFLALTLAVLLLYALSQLLPGTHFPLIGQYSLRNRIQVLVVVLTLLSFAIVGGVTISFYKSNVANWQQSINGFIGSLINVYTFLLLATGVLAISVANYITQPIVRLGEKLKNLQLGKNEPINWRSQDEIGDLIAEYNRMIAKLEESTTQLKRSERESAWREMAKQVAHEIKNPLTPMKLSIQHLQRTIQANPQEAEALTRRVSGTLIEQIDGLARIATEFSNFAKMPKPENQTFALNEVVESVFALFAANPAHNVELKLELPTEKLSVFADKDHIIRVLNNLLTNASQAIPDDRQGRIRVALVANGNFAIVQVQDNGSGIPAELQEKVFQPNFTTKSSGTGLGLAMSKNIVEAAGGRIYFASEVGKGTTFFVELPISDF